MILSIFTYANQQNQKEKTDLVWTNQQNEGKEATIQGTLHPSGRNQRQWKTKAKVDVYNIREDVNMKGIPIVEGSRLTEDRSS